MDSDLPVQNTQPNIGPVEGYVPFIAAETQREPLKETAVEQTFSPITLQEEINEPINTLATLAEDPKPTHIVDERAQITSLTEVTTNDPDTAFADAKEKKFIENVEEKNNGTK